MNEIRRAAVAGSFYPQNKQELYSTVDTLLGERGGIDKSIKAIIVPHAGYIYSGSTAAELYKLLDKNFSRVILMGPSHHVAFKGMATSSAKYYETPLGLIELDTEIIQAISAQTVCLDRAHLNEHSLEVHLPFLQHHLNNFKLVPIVIGNAKKEEVASLIERLWGGQETLILISSDMSHFLSFEDAKRVDQATSAKILSLNASLTGEEACGCHAINGLLHLAKAKKYDISQVSLTNSGDATGDTAANKSSVVGYGAFALHQTSCEFSTPPRQQIIQLARHSILHGLTRKSSFNIELSAYSERLKLEGASFITININGQLRGCIGSLEAHRPLLLDIAHNAQAAAFKDPRFPSLTIEEFQNIEILASILSRPQALGIMSFDELLETIRPGIDGIILEENGRGATYLPSVWKQLPSAPDFIRSLRQKAGLPTDSWQNCQIQRYTTEEFS
ncbi:MAG: AmmeMemoRadiSam system protein B [Pseudomonadales bacterium]|nr:AmmeMemoRadiSam system protein B [Pseudomonadales bacterium]